MTTNGKFFELLAAEVAAGSTIKASAEKIGCSLTHAYRICSSTEFASRVSELRTEVVKGIVARLVAISVRAVEVLDGLLSSSEESVRLNASKAVLNSLLPLSEHLELRKRIDSLENQQQLRIAK